MNAQRAALSRLARAAQIHKGEAVPTDQEQDADAAWFRWADARNEPTATPGPYPAAYDPRTGTEAFFYALVGEMNASWALGLSSAYPRGRWVRSERTGHTWDDSDGDAAESDLIATTVSPEVLDRVATLVIVTGTGQDTPLPAAEPEAADPFPPFVPWVLDGPEPDAEPTPDVPSAVAVEPDLEPLPEPLEAAMERFNAASDEQDAAEAGEFDVWAAGGAA